ncbi:hypothetical protein QA599_19660, partial [Haloarculaceae archaeon H-GB1-1]|nr:hypothetical protein [Haloarculaceae archaeon H-GB1-1]
MTEPDARLKISDRPQVIFKGPRGEVEIEAQADTGADRTTIDHMVAKKIGAGPVEKVVQVNGTNRRVVVPVQIELAGEELSVLASISDRRGSEYREGERKPETDAHLDRPVLNSSACTWDGTTRLTQTRGFRNEYRQNPRRVSIQVHQRALVNRWTVSASTVRTSGMKRETADVHVED